MFKNYFKIAIRNLLKSKIYSSINIFGLTVGLAVGMLVLGFVSYEMSFEDFHSNKNRIYRLEGKFLQGEDQVTSARVMAPLGAALIGEIPEIENAAVFRSKIIKNIIIDEMKYRIEDKFASHTYAHKPKMLFTGPEFFQVFSFEMERGNPETALRDPNSVIISRGFADTYFAEEDPIGRTIRFNELFDCRITGILKDMPGNTQLHSNYIASYATLERMGEDVNSWEVSDTDYAYLLLKAGATPLQIPGKVSEILENHLPEKEAETFQFYLNPFKDIYFSGFSGVRGQFSPCGEYSLIMTLILVGAFVLIIAIANFINLSTARASDRMKEVGIRKVFGAYRWHLIRQFLGESVLISFVAAFLSLIIYEIVTARIQPNLPRENFIDFFQQPRVFMAIGALVLLTGIAAGFYPALYLSRFKPITVLQTKVSFKSSRSLLRKSLVIFQFVVAVVFVFNTNVIYRQFKFITSIDPGFDSENILLLDFAGDNAAENCRLVKQELLNKNNIISASATNCPPGRKDYSGYGFYPDETRERENMLVVKLFEADADFVRTFGLQLTDGDNLEMGIDSEFSRKILVNEGMVKKLNLTDPVGHKIYSGKSFYEIAGVLKEFHGTALDHQHKDMTIVRLNPDNCTTLALKLPPGNINQNLMEIEKTWKRVMPNEPFLTSFLDDEMVQNYSSYEAQTHIFLYLSLLTIAIACLGIYGLVSFTAEKRTKEIGIRKVLGATVGSIIKMLSREFVVLIIIANLIAWPLGYLMVTDFLRYFPFRVGIGFGTFAFTTTVSLLLALGAAGSRALHAAMTNPADTMRHE